MLSGDHFPHNVGGKLGIERCGLELLVPRVGPGSRRYRPFAPPRLFLTERQPMRVSVFVLGMWNPRLRPISATGISVRLLIKWRQTLPYLFHAGSELAFLPLCTDLWTGKSNSHKLIQIVRTSATVRVGHSYYGRTHRFCQLPSVGRTSLTLKRSANKHWQYHHARACPLPLDFSTRYMKFM